MFLEEAKQLRRPLEFHLPTSLLKTAGRCLSVPNPLNHKNHELRAIFVHVPKTAGTSIQKAIFDQPARHYPAVRYMAFDREAFDRYFKFAFVRNPWDRFASAFHYLWRRRAAPPDFEDHRWARHHLADIGNFEEFVYKMMRERSFRSVVCKYIHFIPQEMWISCPTYRGRKIVVDFVGKYENLEKDFISICERIGINANLEWHRKGDIRNYCKMYDAKMIDFVSDIYGRDIQQFGYESPSR